MGEHITAHIIFNGSTHDMSKIVNAKEQAKIEEVHCHQKTYPVQNALHVFLRKLHV